MSIHTCQSHKGVITPVVADHAKIGQLNMSPVGKCTRWTAPVDFYYPKAASSMLQEELVASTKSIFKSTMNIPYTSSVLFLFTARAEQRFRRGQA
jgi:hypothetical protein